MRTPAEDRGETLLELLIAVVILGVVLVSVVGGFATGTLTSDAHRKQSTAAAYAKDYAEAIQSAVTKATVPYTGCASATTYAAPPGFSAPSGYVTSVTTVRYWTGSAWSATCSSDTGVQRLTARVASVDGRATEQVTLVLRKPCGPGSSC
jgi:prepilin-type N-terminal cleavage/methylation domain-containing protein